MRRSLFSLALSIILAALFAAGAAADGIPAPWMPTGH
jgi:hypothetical protein